jgi:hypothetical protein
MLTKFAAALLATSLIAGSAIAAQPSGMAASNGCRAGGPDPDAGHAGGQDG